MLESSYAKDRNLPDRIQKHLRKIPLDTSNASSKFCICDGLDTGSFMIQSEEWRDLFYTACGNVTKEYAEKFALICARAVTISDFMFLFYLLGYIVLTWIISII